MEAFREKTVKNTKIARKVPCFMVGQGLDFGTSYWTELTEQVPSRASSIEGSRQYRDTDTSILSISILRYRYRYQFFQYRDTDTHDTEVYDTSIPIPIPVPPVSRYRYPRYRGLRYFDTDTFFSQDTQKQRIFT